MKTAEWKYAVQYYNITPITLNRFFADGQSSGCEKLVRAGESRRWCYLLFVKKHSNGLTMFQMFQNTADYLTEQSPASVVTSIGEVWRVIHRHMIRGKWYSNPLMYQLPSCHYGNIGKHLSSRCKCVYSSTFSFLLFELSIPKHKLLVLL